MFTNRRYTELPGFLSTLADAAQDYENPRLYITGEYAFCTVMSGFLPKTVEIRGTLTQGEMLALCDRKKLNYSVHGQDVLILNGDKRFIYCELKDKSMDADAATRDFSINAFYISVNDGVLFDPLSALSDIEAGMLKTAYDPFVSFSEHPTRILQMVRLCCEFDYKVCDDVLEAAKANSHALSHISADTIRTNLFSVLMSDTSKVYEGKDVSGDNSPVLRGLLMLRNMDAFAHILPELEAGRGIEQKKRYHIYDVQGHMLHTCAETPPRLYMRVAGLLHDIGKPKSYEQNEGRNMHGHDRIGAMLAREILHRLHCREDFVNRVCRIIAVHMYDVAGIAKEDALRKRFAVWGFRLTQDLIDFRFADVAGSGCPDRKSDSAQRFRAIFEQMKSENVPFSIYELRITGREIAEILNLNSGAEINDVKRDLLRICAVSPEQNDNKALIGIVKDMKSSLIVEE